MKSFIQILYLSFVLFSVEGRTQPTETFHEASKTRLPLQNFGEWSSRSSSEMSLSYENYLSSSKPSYSSNLYESNALVEWHPHWQSQGRFFDYKVDSAFTFSSGEEWLYPKLSDAYIRRKSWRLGFVKENWSSFEEEWRLGLYRPRFMDNKLTGGQGGLLGLHYQQGDFLFSLLPLNIPELGPHFKVQDGRFVSKNPWFGQRIERLNYNGEQMPIRYMVNMPPLSDIVLKPGLAVNYKKQWSRHYLLNLSGAYKPLPQILLNFPADQKVILGEREQYFSAEIQPVVAYHTLLSMDHEWKAAETTRFRFSSAYEIPQIPDRPSSWVTQETSRALYLSSRWEQDFSGAQIFISQFKVWGGDQHDKGRYASDETFFEKRQFFREAYGLGLNFHLFGKLTNEIGFYYDRIQKGAALVTEHSWPVRADLSLRAAVEILGLVGEDDPLPDGFFSYYRANDRAELGVRYVF